MCAITKTIQLAPFPFRPLRLDSAARQVNAPLSTCPPHALELTPQFSAYRTQVESQVPCAPLPCARRSQCDRKTYTPFPVHRSRVHALCRKQLAPPIRAISHPSPVCAVRDLSRASVTLAPAEYASWNEARTELCVAAIQPLCPSPHTYTLLTLRRPRTGWSR